LLRQQLKQQLAEGNTSLVDRYVPEFEKILIEEALLSSQGHKQLAAKKLGWGRNTLTRKQKELF